MKQGVVNLIEWFKVVWKYRWWDFGFSLMMIKRDLELKEKRWGVDTNYVGDSFTKKRIQVLLRQLERYEDAVDIYDEDMQLKKFMKMYGRNIHRLWD
jgi:hypothetical protein